MMTLNIEVPSASIVYDKKLLKTTMRKAGGEIAAIARRLIKSNGGDGRKYYGTGGGRAAAFRGGYHGVRFGYQASSPGQPPSGLNGTLAKSIKVRPFKSGEGVAIRDTMFYALFLQAGAKGGGGTKAAKNRRGGKTGSRVLLPRPFLTTALAQKSESIEARVKSAVIDGIAFKRQR